MKEICIGTSGFSYASWKKTFYPEGLPSSRWLAYYSTKFNSLELNSTFYRFPTVASLKKLYDVTPSGFIFSLKAQKIITHTLRMKNVKPKVLEFTQIAQDGLNEKLGCILFQLPPSFKYSEENLNAVLEGLSSSNRNVVEFRNSSWWNDDAVNALRKHTLTFCNVSFPGLPENFYNTSDLFYLRMHGVPELFKSSYTNADLKRMVKKIPEEIKECFIYFNNTMFEAGFSNALSLKALMEK